ncbi:photosynthetic reaction center subunit H [Methylocystis sp. L43]|jgi:photosynthetic reaction center H subunit|uniref:photosynthetic reaction center subunit H n=1 Tax=unclassified Methylocystis TaxID=2625913 RepID=UPI0018C1D2D3|nr:MULTISPECIES: photosynthetic reaction center subunit H [unclassified Methylocystis]MBG0797788.1 photosynthetic reaction center subunit H [Methylocystis sp. L43]MBG0806022.1 photosynthetic reaction center subunit H [Methylocystis sp. H15]
MIRGAITSNIDVAQVVLYAFFIFFAGLVFYLRREDRREGYPLESEVGPQRDRGFLLIPTPKIFLRGDGAKIQAPNFERDTRAPNATKVAVWPGAPLTPNGDPMLAEVGPGAFALRADVPEKMHDGRDLIAPLRIATNFAVSSEDPNPIGMEVVAADRRIAGVIKDAWVDRAEDFLRFYEVTLSEGRGDVLLPVPFAKVDGARRQIHVEAILADQFANVPRTRNPDQVTLLEEEKIAAYYGAGTLYATPARVEPLL